MKTKKFAYLGIICLVCLGLWEIVNHQKELKTSPGLVEKSSLEGSWKYKADESDFALEKSRKLFLPSNKSSKNTKKSTQQQAEISTLAIFLFPPEVLLFERSKDEITINETFKEMEQSRTVLLDSKMRPLLQNFGVGLFISAVAESDFLLIVTKSQSGNQLIETYKLLENGNKLQVLVQITDSGKKELVMLRRVYQRINSTQFLPITDQSF